MGSSAIQGKLWGRQPREWGTIQEHTSYSVYGTVLIGLSIEPGDTLLDVGCGTGLFSSMAVAAGAAVTGIDASEPLLAEAKVREPKAEFLQGDMEELPFDDSSFDLVCGFNSFQYAASTKNALAEAYRVLKPGGKITAMIWGNKEDCEGATYLKAVGSLLPPPPPGAPGPFALSENHALETVLAEAGFKNIVSEDADATWTYPDAATALSGLMSAGPVTRAIDNSGFDKVKETITAAMQPYIKADGRVVYVNKFRIVMADK